MKKYFKNILMGENGYLDEIDLNTDYLQIIECLHKNFHNFQKL